MSKSITTPKQPNLPTPFSMPIGNKFEHNIESYHPGFRTIAQFETVRKITLRENFHFSTGPKQMFTPEKPTSYKGPFAFLYYDTENKMHCFWILANGTYNEKRILQKL